MNLYRQAYSTDLSGAEWQILEPLLPPEKPRGHNRKYQMIRAVIHSAEVLDRDGAMFVLSAAKAVCDRVKLVWADTG